MGAEIGMLGGYGFQGQVTEGDGSDKKGKMRKAAVQSGTRGRRLQLKSG